MSCFDTDMMNLALSEAEKAGLSGEVPVGAVLVLDGAIVARAGNKLISTHDPTGHAEIRVLRKAGRVLGNYRFPEATLYVTLEPCVMCAGALVQARIKRLVFGAEDCKSGGVISKYLVGSDGKLNHTYQVTGNVLGEESALLLQSFFQKIRQK